MSKDKPGVKLTKEELQNLINMVATHPTPEGIGSAQADVKRQLINKLSQMIDPKTA